MFELRSECGSIWNLLLLLASCKDKQRLLRRPRWKKKARAWMLKAEVSSDSCGICRYLIKVLAGAVMLHGGPTSSVHLPV